MSDDGRQATGVDEDGEKVDFEREPEGRDWKVMGDSGAPAKAERRSTLLHTSLAETGARNAYEDVGTTIVT